MAARRDATASVLGQVWPVAAGILVVPVYLGQFGAEGYGLIALLTSLQAVIAIFDLGMSATATRHIARRASTEGGLATLLRSLEAWYWPLTAALAVPILATAATVGVRIVDAESLGPAQVRTSLLYLGAVLLTRIPVALYTGAMRGYQRHVALNLSTGVWVTLRHGGGAVLSLLGVSLPGCFAWFLAVALLELASMGALAWRATPDRASRRFDRSLLRTMWREARNVAVISILAASIKQVDRLIVVALLPLASLGVYGVATTASGGILVIPIALFAIVLPRLSGLLPTDEAQAIRVYHRAARAVAMTAAPAAGVMIGAAEPLIELWTGSASTAAAAATPVRLLAVAFLLNALMQLPWALQLAAGDTRVQLWVTGVSAFVSVPLAFGLVRTLGLAGASITWLVFNVVYVAVVPVALDRRIATGHLRGFVSATAPSLLATAPVAGVTALLVHALRGSSLPAVVLAAGLGGAATFVAALGPRRMLRHVQDVLSLTREPAPPGTRTATP